MRKRRFASCQRYARKRALAVLSVTSATAEAERESIELDEPCDQNARNGKGLQDARNAPPAVLKMPPLPGAFPRRYERIRRFIERISVQHPIFDFPATAAANLRARRYGSYIIGMVFWTDGQVLQHAVR